MRGRKPVPNQLKVVRGSNRVNYDEPEPPAGKPKRPSWLTGEARTYWARLVRLLDRMHVLTVADGPALALLAVTYAEYVAADRALRDAAGLEHPTYVVVGTAGGMLHKTRPEVHIRADAHRRLIQAMAQFGLTPADRSRLKVGTTQSENPFDGLVKAAR
jgi:P27 family predicted phage terminase small subunit